MARISNVATTLDKYHEENPIINIVFDVGNNLVSGVLMTYPEARPYLDFDFDAGYGSVKGPVIYAWTETTILFTVTYDGSEWISSIPRHPGEYMPNYYGSG